MAEICTSIEERITSQVVKRIDIWIADLKKKCKKKKCKWWCLCCNKWFCWLAFVILHLIKWIVGWVTALVTRVICEIVNGVLDVLGFVVGLIFSIPVIGRLLREVWDIFLEIAWRMISLPGFLMDYMGLDDIEKNLRVCIIILSNKERAMATAEELDPAIQEAIQIYRDEADVNFIVEAIHVVPEPAPDRNLFVSCGAAAWGEDLLTQGSYFEFIANKVCFDGAGRRLTGFASPVVVFVVRSVTGDPVGCSIGIIGDYVTIEGPNGICLAHEVGHACGLWHVSDSTNLMFRTCGRTQLDGFQKALLRNSRHVSYL